MTRRTKAEIEHAKNNVPGRQLVEFIWAKIEASGTGKIGAKSYAEAKKMGVSVSYLECLRRGTPGYRADNMKMKVYRKIAAYLEVSLLEVLLLAEVLTAAEAGFDLEITES